MSIREIDPYIQTFEIQIAQETFVYRCINRAEYKSIFDRQLDMLDFQEAISALGLLSPVNYSFQDCPAGVPETLCDEIMTASCLQPGKAKEVLEFYRQEMLIFDHQADCLIHEAFPEFDLQVISQWSVEQTLFYLSRAEYILTTFRGVPLQQIGDVSESSEKYAEPVTNIVKPVPEKQIPVTLNEVNKPTDFFPELKWFETYDELTGHYD